MDEPRMTRIKEVAVDNGDGDCPAKCNTIRVMGTRDASGAGRKRSPSPLVIRLDAESQQVLAAAAELRRLSISDYIRTVSVAQARREAQSAQDRTIQLSPAEQFTFWRALHGPVTLTPAQKRLGAVMQGRS